MGLMTPQRVFELEQSGCHWVVVFFPVLVLRYTSFRWLRRGYLLGKYNTICCGTAIYIAGIFILFITSIPSVGNRDSAIGGFIAAIDPAIGIATGLPLKLTFPC